jgi:TatD DNase family protein
LIDSHTHYDEERFDTDKHDIIMKAHEQGVICMVNVSNCMQSSFVSLQLSVEYDFIYAAIGIHPYFADEISDENISRLRDLANGKKVVAIGETGLDYCNMTFSKQVQKECFACQIALARELNLPIMIHDRDAHQDVFDMLASFGAGNIKGVMHNYSGSVDMAKRYLNLGFYISFAGPVTYINARKILDVVRFVPLSRMLIETDCPDLSPEPFRGTRNDSTRLKLIAEKIAEIKDLSLAEVSMATTENARRLLGIK